MNHDGALEDYDHAAMHHPEPTERTDRSGHQVAPVIGAEAYAQQLPYEVELLRRATRGSK